MSTFGAVLLQVRAVGAPTPFDDVAGECFPLSRQPSFLVQLSHKSLPCPTPVKLSHEAPGREMALAPPTA
jgi:hypothetical protein